MKTPLRIVVTMELPSEISELLKDATTKLNLTQGNAWINPGVLIPGAPAIVIPVPYDEAARHIATAVAAEAAVGTAPGATQARNTAVNIVIVDERAYMRMIQEVVDTNPTHGEEIALGCGYHIEHPVTKNKQDFIVKHLSLIHI